MKNILGIVIVLAVLVGGFFAFNRYIYNEKQADVSVGETIVEDGVILAIDLEPLTYDGSAMITIETSNGVAKNVAIPARGFSMCPGFANVVELNSLGVGKTIEVKGELDSDGTIVPCVSGDHYLRIK